MTSSTPPASGSPGGRIAIIFAVILALTCAFLVRSLLKMQESKRASHEALSMESQRTQQAVSGRGACTDELGGLRRQYDRLASGLDSLRQELERQRRRCKEQVTEKAAVAGPNVDSLLEGFDVQRMLFRASADSLMRILDSLRSRFADAENSLRRLRAEHDIRVLFVLDCYVSLHPCPPESAAECSSRMREIIARFDVAQSILGWDVLYCDVRKQVLAVNAGEGCLEIQRLSERLGFAVEPAFYLSRLYGPGACALRKDQMRFVFADGLKRYDEARTVCSPAVAEFASQIVPTGFARDFLGRVKE